MRALVLDKVGSVTRNCQLRHDVRVVDDYPCREGDVVAVRVLSSKTSYNTLELPTGRMSPLRAGDVIAGVLGHRKALFGYAGDLPEGLSTGDEINILNLGGVLGRCTATSPALGEPFRCEVLGQVLSFPTMGSRVGVPATIVDGARPIESELAASMPPVIAVVGSCMNSGKTEACLTLVHGLARRGLKVAAGKTTGVSLLRDTFAMEDAGAFKTLCFTDFGVVTTTASTACGAAVSILNGLAKERPDVIVLELGDGLIGAYGVDSILADPALRQAFSSVVLSANDPVAAWGGVEILRTRFGIPTRVVTGPATDNVAGTVLVTEQTGVAAFNARTQPDEFLAAATKEVAGA